MFVNKIRPLSGSKNSVDGKNVNFGVKMTDEELTRAMMYKILEGKPVTEALPKKNFLEKLADCIGGIFEGAEDNHPFDSNY